MKNTPAKTQNPALVRQGDVLLVPTTRKGATPAPRDADGSTTLAHGEVTGHRHRFVAGSAVTLRQESEIPSDRFLLEVGPGGADLVHEEHSTIAVAPGTYEVRIQCEYDPAVHGGARRVED